MEPAFPAAGFCMVTAILLVMMMIIIMTSIRIVREETRLSVYRLGRYIGDKGPGLVLLMPVIDKGVLKQVGDMQNTLGRSLVGAAGEARTTIYTDGKVILANEEWDAMSHTPISAGQRVRVLRMVLEVEKE
jgi:regulator of protease activity HflC (stomatin/prohibitin superfamily)